MLSWLHVFSSAYLSTLFLLIFHPTQRQVEINYLLRKSNGSQNQNFVLWTKMSLSLLYNHVFFYHVPSVHLFLYILLIAL